MEDNWTFLFTKITFNNKSYKTKTIEKDDGLKSPSEVSAKETFTLAWSLVCVRHSSWLDAFTDSACQIAQWPFPEKISILVEHCYLQVLCVMWHGWKLLSLAFSLSCTQYKPCLTISLYLIILILFLCQCDFARG